MTYDGNTLIQMGYKPGKHFPEMLQVANGLAEHDIGQEQIREALDEIYDEATFEEPTIPLKESGKFSVYLDEGTTEYEKNNNTAVMEHVKELVRVPTIVDAAVMPDACPAGSAMGTIPVGCVAVAENAIHPGMHSADICCSMYLTVLDIEGTPENAKTVLDSVQKVSHFGVGGRKEYPLGHHHYIVDQAHNNPFLASVRMFKAMSEHHATQGDGNHFFFVGKLESTGQLTLVTHHGSRKPGALLYKDGMRVAELYRQKLSPDTPKHNAWIPFDTEDGQNYWEALQIIREWTKYNHTTIHNEVMLDAFGIRDYVDRFWNEHNFVFKQGTKFYHAKGSTPVFGNHAHDADPNGRTIIPLNMGEDILIVKDHPNNEFGFAPHGAGRYMSRTQYMKTKAGKTVEQLMKEEVGHIDARFYTGKPDMSELPGAYKNAKSVENQIQQYQLATVYDRVNPLGSMMAGEVDKPWRKK